MNAGLSMGAGQGMGQPGMMPQGMGPQHHTMHQPNMQQHMMQPQQAMMMQHNMLQQQQMAMHWQQQQQQQQGMPHMMNPGMMQGAGGLSMYSNTGSGGAGLMGMGMGMGDMRAAPPSEVKEKEQEKPQEPEKPDIFAGFGDLSSFKKNKPAAQVALAADNPFGF